MINLPYKNCYFLKNEENTPDHHLMNLMHNIEVIHNYGNYQFL